MSFPFRMAVFLGAMLVLGRVGPQNFASFEGSRYLGQLFAFILRGLTT